MSLYPRYRLLRHMSIPTFFLVLCLTAWAVEPYQTDFVEPKVSTQLPRSIVDHLSPNGMLLFTYSNGLKSSIAEIFWAKEVSLQDGRAKSSRINYADLKPGSFLGVIHFLPEATEEYREDFHDQKLRPGYYTMRYQVTSDADVHDPVVLSPIGLDSDATRARTASELLGISRVASRTSRPAMMSLVPAESGESASKVRTSDDGACVVQESVPASSSGKVVGVLDLAIILVKPIPDGEGS